jgi:hypothetical protein
MDHRFQAVIKGHLNVVKWYHKHGLPCDGETYDWACRYRRFKLQLWLLQNVCDGEPASKAKGRKWSESIRNVICSKEHNGVPALPFE